MRDFDLMWQFPNCCGAIDGKHVAIRCPSRSGSTFFNYKKTFSTILFAVADAHSNFIYIDVGTNGRVNDAAVFRKSAFNAALGKNLLQVPDHGVFVADDAFPLRKDLLKPYSRCGSLSQRQEVFNCRLSRARRVVENAFGLLVSRFRVYEKPLPLSLATTEKVVKTTCALHNWLRRTSPACEDVTPRPLGPDGAFHGLVPEENCTQPRAGTRLRDSYAELFHTTYRLPWQGDQ